MITLFTTVLIIALALLLAAIVTPVAFRLLSLLDDLLRPSLSRETTNYVPFSIAEPIRFTNTKFSAGGIGGTVLATALVVSMSTLSVRDSASDQAQVFGLHG